MAEDTGSKQKCQPRGRQAAGGVSGGAYGLGFIGALVYFLQHANTFWLVILGILKAIVWPGFLVYKLLQFIGA